MASSQSSPKGQVPLCCNLCEIETKITTKCLDCDLLMCNKCRDKVHPKFKNAKDHKIVDIKDIGMYALEIDFTHIKCQEHAGQNCCLFCVSCDLLVCPLCISKTHNGHGLIEISKGYEIKLDRLKQNKNRIQSDLQKLNKHQVNLEDLHKSEGEQYKETRDKIQAQNEALKTAVNQFTESIEKELQQTMNLYQKSTEKEKKKINQLKKKAEDQMSTLNDIFTAKDAAKVFTCSNAIKHLTEEVELLPCLQLKVNQANKIPTFCPGEISQKVFGSLQNKTSMTISEQFLTGIPRIDNISVCSDDSVWICSSDKPGILTKVKPEKGNLKVIHRLEIQVFDMAITQSQDILLSTGESRLQLVNDNTGKITDSCINVYPLLTVSIHVTLSNKIIVGAASDRSDNPRKGCIITMNSTGEHEVKYEYDKHKQSIFNLPWKIKSTSNGNICVLDRLSIDCSGKIVVLDQSGDVIQIYRGHSQINNPNKPFKPCDLAVTTLDKIIIKNKGMSIFHILDNLGYYITHFDTTDIGIIHPFTLCFSRTGFLYIGSTTRKGSNDKAKLYKVKISEY